MTIVIILGGAVHAIGSCVTFLLTFQQVIDAHLLLFRLVLKLFKRTLNAKNIYSITLKKVASTSLRV